jgi:hypothetical protein
VVSHQVSQIHAIELVTGEDEHYVAILHGNVLQIFAHGIGISNVPVFADGVCLLGGKNINYAVAEIVEAVGVLDVPVQ